jgi:hypothetical protein
MNAISARCRRSILAFSTMIACYTTAAVAQPVLTGTGFAQTDFLDLYGNMAERNSLWGNFSFSYDPDPAEFYYLNLKIANASGDPGVWAVQNLPLTTGLNGDLSHRSENVHINLQDLGYQSGDDWTNAYYTVSIDSAIRMVAPTGTLSPSPVTDFTEDTWLESMPFDASTFSAGAPGNFVNREPVAPPVILEHDLKHLDEDPEYCMAGSFARSLDWLNRHNDLGLPDLQGIYDDLKQWGVSDPGYPGFLTPPQAHAKWLLEKQGYMNKKAPGRVVTKVIDLLSEVDPTPGISQQEGGDLFAWLKREWEHGEDIELAYAHSTGKHIKAVRDLVFDRSGRPLRLLTQDDKQGKPDASDRMRVERIVLTSDGLYHMENVNRYVLFAVSESVPEPGTFYLLAVGCLALLAGRRGLRRYRQ